MPTTDFYTRHYLTATMIVWATTFSLLALFIPKLHAFFSPKANSGKSHGNTSNLSQKKRSVCDMVNAQSSNDNVNNGDATYLPTEFGCMQRSDSEYSGLKSLNYMINNMSHYGDSTPSKVKLNSLNKKGRIEGAMMEVHEVGFIKDTGCPFAYIYLSPFSPLFYFQITDMHVLSFIYRSKSRYSIRLDTFPI